MNPAILKADLTLVEGKMIREDIVEFNGPKLSIKLLFLIGRTQKHQYELAERDAACDLILSGLEPLGRWNIIIESISPSKFRLIGDWQEFDDFLQSSGVKILSLEDQNKKKKKRCSIF